MIKAEWTNADALSLQPTCNQLATDCISRQAAIDAVEHIDWYHLNARGEMVSGANSAEHQAWYKADDIYKALEDLPSARPERLTDDDFETIRIHLNAYKEKLCNQQRWEEAEEYQRIIDRFMAFATAQQEIIRCKECKKNPHWAWVGCPMTGKGTRKPEDFCSYAERREE